MPVAVWSAGLQLPHWNETTDVVYSISCLVLNLYYTQLWEKGFNKRIA